MQRSQLSALAGMVTVLLHCRKSLFLEGLSNRADNVAGDGGVRSAG